MKSPFKSKTLWVNAVMAVLAFFPSVADNVSSEQVMMLMGAVNFVLRFFTKQPVIDG